jgi:beta-galactosidase
MLSYCDIFKTLKQNKPFWVMETAASFSGCAVGYQPVHRNGYIKAEAAAAYALGASGFSYWLWRQQRSGFEQTHGSVIHSWGKPTVGFNNVVEAGKLRDKLEKVLLKTVPAKAELAVTYSDKARAFFMSEPLDGGFNYVDEMIKWHHMVLDTGIHSDFVFENGSVSDYKVLKVRLSLSCFLNRDFP